MRKNIILCGVGGQGIVLTSKLLAASAMAKGIPVMSAETIGMAQRGGSVASHVRGGHPQSPLVPKGCADCLIAFEPGEAVRCIDYLAPDGTIVVNTQATQPPVAALQGIDYDGFEALAYLRSLSDVTLIEVDGASICEQVGSSKVLNIALLAAAVKSGALGITRDELEDAIRARVKPRFHDMNLRAVALVFGD